MAKSLLAKTLFCIRAFVLTLPEKLFLGWALMSTHTLELEIGKDVLIGPNVYISDRSHQYKDVDVPIKMQGYYTRGNLKIGNGTWIGIHACVIGNVEVGKGCVIGANAVVTKNIPDYCVVVENPARIVKRYDFKEKKWIKMDENKTI